MPPIHHVLLDLPIVFFAKIKTRFSFKTSDGLKDSKNTSEVTDKLSEGSKGTETGAKAAVGEGAEAIEKVAAEELSEIATKEVKQVAKSGKGNAFGLIAGVACGLMDIPEFVSKAVRAYQMAQLVKYAVAIFTSISAMKAGDATPEEGTAVGDLFTKTVDGKSAMDAFGMKYSLFGDTTPLSASYKAFSPGGDLSSTLDGISEVTSSDAKVQACKYATNPATGAAIDVLTSETLIGPLVNVGGWSWAILTYRELPPTSHYRGYRLVKE